MKKWLLLSTLFLAGCLVTTNHNPMTEKRSKEKLWWQKPQYAFVKSHDMDHLCGVAVLDSSSVAPIKSTSGP